MESGDGHVRERLPEGGARLTAPGAFVTWVLRVALAAVVALPALVLWAGSPLGAFLPPEFIVPGVTAGWTLAAGLFLVALVASRSPRSALIGITGPLAVALVVLLYPYARLDWSRLLKNWDLVGTGVPWPLALALAVTALAAAWTLHALALQRALVDRFEAKGTSASETARAGRAAALAARDAGGLALAGVGVLAIAHAGATPLVGALASRLSDASFLVPLLAAGVVAVALAVLLARRDAS